MSDSYEVKLKCYDLSRGMAASIGAQVLGLHIEAVWHTGILCHDLEWFYGGGIQHESPDLVEQEFGMQPLRIMELGRTTRSVAEIEAWCNEKCSDYSEDRYDFLYHNCNSFTNDLSLFLTGKSIPAEIARQHEEIAKHPAGKMIIGIVDGFQKQAKGIQAQGGVGGFLATGRPVNQVAPIPNWTEFPDAFEKFVHETWDDNSLSMDLKREALKRMHLLAYNVTRNATDPKYRTIKADNPVLQKSIFALPLGADMVKALGFSEERDAEGHVYYTIANIHREILSHLNKAANLLTPVAKATESQATNAIPDEPMSYAFQLERLKDLGFTDIAANLKALTEVNGNLNQAIDKLLT